MTPFPARLPLDGLDPGTDGLWLAADVIVPAGPPSALCVCWPGGGFGRGYFDLAIGPDRSRSFLREMAARGLACIAVDHLGIGDSATPADGWGFTPDRLARIEAAAVRRLKQALAEGSLAPGLPATGPLFSVGVGHSMGGLFVILQQAAAAPAGRPYDAVALLGSTAGGLPEALTEAERPYAGDPAAIRANLVRLAQARFGVPYQDYAGHDPAFDFVFAGEDEAATAAIRRTRSRLLALGGLLAMVPGGIAEEAAAIDVPMFLASADRDVGGTVHQAAARFPGSLDLTLLVLADTLHMHFGFRSARTLFDRLASWIGMQA